MRRNRLGRSSWVSLATAALALALALMAAAPASADKKVIILGFDGLDHALTTQLMAEGKLPNFTKLAETGGFTPLETAVPPQSPVAWSDFITGMDAGGHGIFDFLHRDPKKLIPYLSTSKTTGSEKNLEIGKWQMPLSGGEVELLRRGMAFWEFLEDHGIETTIIRMPANFPPSGTATRELSGMGTPDILGGYGTFSYFTTDTSPFAGEKVTGGKVYPVVVLDNTIKSRVYGPTNPFLVKKRKLQAEFTVHVDPVEPVAKVVFGDEEHVLKVGEWSDWVPVEFEMVAFKSLHGIARIYLKQVRPVFQMYVSPINFDPMQADMPVSHPPEYAEELAEMSGRFYTQGMPEDTKALSEKVLTRDEFLGQARIAGEELIEQYHHVLERFDRGLLFYYFGNVDQTSHMLWRTLDPEHPAYDPEVDPRYAHVIEKLYVGLDDVVGHTLDNIDDETTLIVMSDHGFTSWRRTFNLNSWLRDEGYLVLKDPNRPDPGFLLNVDWSRTKAYSYGINGLYFNIRGRERSGIVDESRRAALSKEIGDKLLATIDPTTGAAAVTRVYPRDEYFQDGGSREIGPDIVVGFAKGTRMADKSALGEMSKEVMSDNTEIWSGDHCMDHTTVPGVLLSNRPLKKQATALKNLAASIVAEFGLEGFPPAPAPKP